MKPADMGRALMPPPAPRPSKRRAVAVLEEDEWLSKMDAIIERDFFPELAKLQDKVELLEASRNGDAERMQAAQLRMLERDVGPSRSTPSVCGTAQRALGNTTDHVHGDGDAEWTPRSERDLPAARPSIPNVSLDAFLASHTSEDNASFQEILDRTNARRRERAAKLFPAPQPAEADGTLLLAQSGREKTDGFGTTGQPTDTLVGWKHKSINLLMFDGGTQESLPLSRKETPSMAGATGINHSATRLHVATDNYPRSIEASPSVTVGVDGSAPSALNRPSMGAPYDVLATPSFEPGVEASPFVTWGEIEATPMRIEAEDLPPGSIDSSRHRGPSFHIKETPRREQKALELAAKAGSFLKKRSGTISGMGNTPARAAALAALGRSGGTPARGTGGKPALSDAARRLAGSLLKSESGETDTVLRASYKGTPLRGTGSAWDVDVKATPSISVARSDWTPSYDAPARR